MGGLVGKLFQGTIQSSYATGTVSGIGNTPDSVDQIGGLVGHNYGTIQRSYATGNVSGRYHIGGLVGLSGSGHQTLFVKINNSYATGNVSGRMTYWRVSGRQSRYNYKMLCYARFRKRQDRWISRMESWQNRK